MESSSLSSMTTGNPTSPDRDCGLCPRLVTYRESNRSAQPSWHNAPVPSFGSLDARLLIVGLAPGVTGANATGRPFTGDYAGDLLYGTLAHFGLSRGTFDRRPDDGLELVNCRITNAVRCVPPQNKPTGVEISTCLAFLRDEMDAMANLRVVLALGAIAHNAVLKCLGLKQSGYKFAHGAQHDLPDGLPLLADSYHCSRYNTNTGRLTTEMFRSAFAQIIDRLDELARVPPARHGIPGDRAAMEG